VEPPTNITYVQSNLVHHTDKMVGAARMRWYESKPPGTDIIYKMTADGKNWVTMENNTHHIFEHPGSPLRWNATIKTDDKAISPYLDKIVIEYDLVSDPVPKLPEEEKWQGTQTPKLEWNFTDPDKFDHQTDYLLEIYDTRSMDNLVYSTPWINSTTSEHTV